MNTLNSIVLRVFVVLIIILLGLLVAAIAVGMARHEGTSWTRALKQGATGFVATSTLMLAAYVAFVHFP
ncbi:hypothetical protein ACFXNW_28950 [Nocardia sp. NPDC059180]|uniref:hypothetical protein n=1 Tax=Nocardia sp. NPDC059180 TaxID=3346761 RepID=UPI003690DBBA